MTEQPLRFLLGNLLLFFILPVWLAYWLLTIATEIAKRVIVHNAATATKIQGAIGTTFLFRSFNRLPAAWTRFFCKN